MNVRKVLQKIKFRPACLPAIIAVIVVVAASFYAEHQNNQVYQQKQRADVLNQIDLIRARLEGNLNTNIQLVQGLVNSISAGRSIDQERLTGIASNLFGPDNQLSLIVTAPNMIVSSVYPLEGNEPMIGFDYRNIPERLRTGFDMQDSGHVVVAGPVNYLRSGRSFVSRFPVFVDQPSGEHEFWGIVSAAIDVEALYEASGLTENLGIEVALRGVHGRGADGEQFYGPTDLFDSDPVVEDFYLPSGTWQIAATPKGGWNTTPPNTWIVRGFAFLAGCLVILPIFIAGWLIGERYDNMRKLYNSENKLDRMSKRLELAMQASNIGVWENEISSGTLFWDKNVRELFGVTHDDPVTYNDWVQCIHPKDLDRTESDFENTVINKEPYNCTYRIVLKNGDVRTIRAFGMVVEDNGGEMRIVGTNSDITAEMKLNEDLRRARMLSEARNAELESAKSRIEHNAKHDSLTGLPNRRYLDAVLAGNADVTFDEDGDHALLHIDLDRFKQINDTLGHAAGDAMLIHAAQILKDNVRATDFLARIGGDEFVVICPTQADKEYLENLAGRLVERMRQPVRYQGRECRFGMSIGIACGASAPASPPQLLINADIALYRAKADGRNRYHFFSHDLHMAAVNTKRLADEIMTGIEQDQFTPHYQAQFDAKTREIAGVEALIRWKHPDEGLLTPDKFLDVAEDLNVMAELDRIVLEKSLKQMKNWKRSELDIPHVSVNVSARRLHDKGLVAGLKDLKIQPGTVNFELVESIFLDDSSDLVAWNIDQIKELGIGIEIDDFGTGYTSILSLMRLRPDRLKIDRRLVLPITETDTQRDLVQSIIQIGASLGIDAVGEGVETLEHADILRDIGCKTLQGYVFARPISGRAFTQFAKAYTPAKSKAA